MKAYASIWLTLVDGRAMQCLDKGKTVPLVRIDIRKGKDVAYRQEIGRVVYEALVGAGAPKDDRFQVIMVAIEED